MHLLFKKKKTSWTELNKIVRSKMSIKGFSTYSRPTHSPEDFLKKKKLKQNTHHIKTDIYSVPQAFGMLWALCCYCLHLVPGHSLHLKTQPCPQ